MMIPSQTRILTTALLFCLLAVSCTTSVREPQQPETSPLKVVILPYLSYAPIFMALEEGYFAEQGLHIEFVKLNSSDEAIPALARGQLDVLGAVISAGTLNAIARGAGIKIVADRSYAAATGCDYAALIARRALVEAGALDNPAQWKGRSIAINPTYEAFFLETVLRQVGQTTEALRVLDLPPPVLLDAFAEGKIDLAVIGEPWVTRLQSAGQAVIWRSVKETLPDFQLGFILYGPNLLVKNLDAGRRFIEAYLKAVRQLGQGKTERNLGILAKHTQLDQDLLRQACWPTFRDNGQINTQSVLEFQTWAVGKGLVDQPLTVDQFWEPRFIQAAADQTRR